MGKTTIIILSLCIFAFGFVACDSGSTEGGGSSEGVTDGGAGADAGCICDQGKAGESIWCDDCSVGYVAKEKIACEGCFAAKTGGPDCPTCSSE